MKKNKGNSRSIMTKKILGIEKPSDWLRALRAIRGPLRTADAVTRRQMGITIVSFAPMLDLDDKSLLGFLGVSKDAVERAIPADFLHARGLYFCLVNSPQLSPVCKMFFDAWSSVAMELAQSRWML